MNKIFVLAVLPCALGVKCAYASALLKPTSGVTQALTPKALQIESNLKGAFAQTTVTTTYANPNSRQIEADFMYSAPKGSVVTGFAYWYGEEKVVARVVEKGRAAKIYQYITSRMRDPALIEMVGPNKFRARIFPVEANTDLKIEVRLAQTLGATKAGQLWSWPLREETSSNALRNVSIHLKSDRAFRSNLGTVQNNELKFQKTNFRATGNANALVAQNPAPLRAALLAARDGGTDGFFALALTSNSPVALPRLNISGVSTYNVLVPTVRRLDANGNFVVTGRYRGSGTALVSLNGRSVQVKFPETRETNNLPSLLWASGRIESLSGKDANKTQVMALSKRFGVPSKWTSWLAIPEEERKNFRRQMWASDRADAAKSYAQAVSRGDAAQMMAQKAVFDDLTQKIKADGPNYAETEELQPLSSYLNDELRAIRRAMVQAKYDGKVSKTQSAQWTLWAKNLQKAGASDGGKGVDLPVYVIEDELRIASRLYLQEIEAGRKNGRQARKYKARLKELAGTKTAQEYGWGETAFIDEQAEVRSNALAMDIATLRASDRPDRKRLKQAEQRLARLASADLGDTQEALQSALEEVWGAKISAVAEKWADEIAAGRAGSNSAQKYARQVRALQARSGLKHIEEVDQAWNSLASKTGTSMAKSIRDQGPNGKAARALDAQIARIAAQAKRPSKELRALAWQQVVESGSSQLSAKIRAGQGKSSEAAVLRRQLDAIARPHNINVDYQVQSAWRDRANSISTQLAAEVKAKRENGSKARELQSELDTAKKQAGNSFYDYQLKYAWDERSRAIAVQAVESALASGAQAPEAQKLQAQVKEYAAKGSTSADRFINAAAGQKMAEIKAKIATEVAAKRDTGSEITVLRTRLEQAQKAFPQADANQWWSSGLGPISEEFAWEGRAHEAAYRLLEKQKSEPGDTGGIDSLQRDLDHSITKGGKDKNEVIDWEKGRLARNEPLVTATEYRLRSGDPLISVVAPATCRQVVAQMPDGTLLPLRFNALNKAWEARFDVPTFAPDGDYRVKILIIAPDGTRRQLTMNFAVDSHAPQGKGAVNIQGQKWHLSLQSDEHTDRVSAFLPWNERIELRRDENAVFVADVDVPEAFGDAKAQVRFLLTDGAHNKTEVLVDLNH